MLFNLMLMFLFCLSIIYWWVGQKAKQVAVAAAKKRCDKLDLQFLDATVSLEKTRIKLHRGQPMLQREFHFEFASQGDERFGGEVLMLGSNVNSIHLDIHTIGD